MTYSDIYNHLYIFDLVDSIGLVGMCNRERIVRNLSIKLVTEAGKLKRLVAGHDTRRCIADILYYQDQLLRERLVDRLSILKMFKARTKHESEAD